MKIYLVQPAYDLSKNKDLEIQALARKLISDKININRIYVNEQEFSVGTGSILSKALKVPIVTDSRFLDVGKDVILGSSDNRDFDNLQNINLFIEEIVDKNDNVLITIGGGIHRIIISKLTGMSLAETRHFRFQNTGVSVLHYDNDTKKWRINSINDVNHLRIP